MTTCVLQARRKRSRKWWANTGNTKLKSNKKFSMPRRTDHRTLCGFVVLLVWSLWNFERHRMNYHDMEQEVPQPVSLAPEDHWSKTKEHWVKTKSWLCPGGVPSLPAAVTVFRLAQHIGLRQKEGKHVKLPDLPASNIEEYYSFWPGHVYARDERSGKTVTFLLTYKCGSETIEEYFKQVPFFGARDQKKWLTQFLNSSAHEADCIATSFRDPIEHFFSGLGELEMRRTKGFAKGEIKPQFHADYEKLDILSEDRLVAFVETLLRGDWFARRVPINWLDFGHVLPQSGYLVGLQQANRTISTFVHLKDLNSTLPHVLEEECGLPEGLPELEKIRLHDKVPGLSEVYAKFWAKGSINELSGKPRLPIIEALCLFHAVDYACLEMELKAPPPEVCAQVFDKYL